jgi:hypothetical protein
MPAKLVKPPPSAVVAPCQTSAPAVVASIAVRPFVLRFEGEVIHLGVHSQVFVIVGHLTHKEQRERQAPSTPVIRIRTQVQVPVLARRKASDMVIG